MTTQPAPYQVLIVDDAPAVREGLRWLLENEPDLLVVGETGDGREAIELATRISPDLVILDIELPGADGFAVAKSLQEAGDPPVIVFLTMHTDAPSRRRALDAGGNAFVAKTGNWAILLAEVRRALAGRPPPPLANPAE
jgi:DNA-binding NarL/FixJ family response regulator